MEYRDWLFLFPPVVFAGSCRPTEISSALPGSRWVLGPRLTASGPRRISPAFSRSRGISPAGSC